MREFKISSRDMATLLLVNAAVYDIIEAEEVNPDILDELEHLQPHLEQIVSKADDNSIVA